MCKIAGGYKRNLGHWFSEVHVDKRRQQRDQNLRWESTMMSSIGKFNPVVQSSPTPSRATSHHNALGAFVNRASDW